MSDTESTLVNTTGGVTINDGPVLAGRLEVTQQIIDVSTAMATKPDLGWELIDANGHFHAYASDGKLPTMITKSRHVDCDLSHEDDDPWGEDDCEGYDVTEHFCRVCDELVDPKRLPTSGQRSMPGLKSWVITVVGDRQIEGPVSVRFAIDGKVYFGVAQALTDSMEGGSDGRVRVTTRLHGNSPLGER